MYWLSGRLRRRPARSWAGGRRGRSAARCWRRCRGSREDRGLQAADVDAQLEGVGGDDAAHLPSRSPRSIAALVRQVAAAVAADRVRMARWRLDARAGSWAAARRRSATGEDDRLDTAADQPLRQALRRAAPAADAQLLVDDRRVDGDDVLRPDGRAVVVDQLTGASMICSASSRGLAMVARRR